MEWFEKIREGMALIKKGCSENTDWIKCYECPFNNFCNLIMDDDEKIPSEAFFPWEEN